MEDEEEDDDLPDVVASVDNADRIDLGWTLLLVEEEGGGGDLVDDDDLFCRAANLRSIAWILASVLHIKVREKRMPWDPRSDQSQYFLPCTCHFLRS